MLRHLGVRSKLLALVAIPMAFLFVITGVLVAGEYQVAQRASNVRALTDVSAYLNEVVHRLQIERSASLDWQVDPSSANANKLRGQRALVDTRLGTLQKAIRSAGLRSFSPEVQQALAAAAQGYSGLGGVRTRIDEHQYGPRDTADFFGRVIAVDLQLPGLIAQEAGDEALGRQLRAYQSLSTAIEQESAERDLLSVALTRGEMQLSEYQSYAGLVSSQTESLRVFRQVATLSQNKALVKILVAADPSAIERYRGMAGDLLNGRLAGSPVTAFEWVQAVNTEILPLSQLEARVVADAGQTAAGIESGQQRSALVLIGLLALGLGLAILLTVVLARRITRPLRSLTTAVTGIGEELPRMVERMQTLGEGPGVEFESIPIESRDEIGKLAEAFNSVNEVTVRVAKEQAALRASIAEMFVNVARRNQVLLGRQLHFIDQMEAREENPEVLENLFRLDHLATRMRRNAESLLVLAGIDGTRRLRSSLPISDVIRTAVSEIESYERVDLAVGIDPEVSGRFALTVAHLMAELLENATHFSNPDTRVVVATSARQQGVEVVVTDYGLGMNAEELAEANERIADPPVAEIAGAQRLGFYVVGRLARRLGASVTVDRGRSGGTVVTVTLPNSVFPSLAEQPAPLAPPVEDVRPEAPVEVAPMTVVAELAAVPFDLGPDEELLLGEPPTEPPARPGRRLLPRRSRRTDDPTRAQAEVPETPDDVDAPVAAEEPEPAPEPSVIAEVVEEVVEEGVDEPTEDAVEVPTEVVEEVVDEGVDEPTEDAVEVPTEVVEEPVAEVTVEEVVAEAAPAQPEPAPAAAPAPVVTFAFVPAVDILPSTAMPARRRFARRHPTPAPAPTQVSEAPAAPPTPAPVAAVVPTPAPVAAAAPVPAEPKPPAPQARPVFDFANAVTDSAVEPTAPETPDVPVVPAVPPIQVPVAAGLTRRPAATSESVPSAPPAEAGVEADSRLHSDALTELRGLYAPSYTPAAVEPVAEQPTGLARRTPKAAEATESAAPAPVARQRTAAEVRGMLSGFRSGVERGRSTPVEAAEDPDEDTEQQ